MSKDDGARGRPTAAAQARQASPVGRAQRVMRQLLPFARAQGPASILAPLPGTPLYLPGEKAADAAELAGGAARDPAILGSIGPLEVRLARSRRDMHRAQRLRYQVFYDEMSARPQAMARLTRRDQDRYDPLCDHLMVLDHDAPPDRRTGEPALVGTYRLLPQQVAERHGGFYTEGEYQIGALVRARPDLSFLELGRSCVLQPYRTKRTVELLWHGIWSYVVQRRIDVLFGCASLEGTDPQRHALALSFLHHEALADDAWRVRAVEGRYTPMNLIPREAVDTKAALKSLPPLIKGYLRLGGMVGDGAVIDPQFGTTDVLIVLPVEKISRRYISYYGAEADRRAN